MLSQIIYSIRGWVIVFLCLLGISSLAYNYIIIEQIEKRERDAIELWAKAIDYVGYASRVTLISRLDSLSNRIQNNPLVSQQDNVEWRKLLIDIKNGYLPVDFIYNEIILQNKLEIPAFVIGEDGKVKQSNNLAEGELSDLVQNPDVNTALSSIPISLGNIGEPVIHTIYYGTSTLLRSMQVLPYFHFFLTTIMIGLGYVSMINMKRKEYSDLWVAMTKETAHQFGTPLSGLNGWTLLLQEKAKNFPSLYPIILELNKDLSRMQEIVNRFSMIGTPPSLNRCLLKKHIQETVNYLKKRLSSQKKPLFEIKVSQSIYVNINALLFEWAIENILRNSVDAVQNVNRESKIEITAQETSTSVIIDIYDNGKGISVKQSRYIFSSGFSSKKKGWGLGLNLSKRIIERYHKGVLKLVRSHVNKGTLMRITLPKGTKTYSTK